MAEKSIEEYKNEMMQMYAAARADQPPYSENKYEDSVGYLQANVTTLRRVLPVEGAVITVFTGDNGNRTVIETDVTDDSGKSGVFSLKTPAKAFSESAAATQRPYALYNLEVKADGYVDRVYLNIPVFSGVTSVQNVDLVSIPAAGSNTSPDISDEMPDYDL